MCLEYPSSMLREAQKTKYRAKRGQQQRELAKGAALYWSRAFNGISRAAVLG
jgi:hypothetical protein